MHFTVQARLVAWTEVGLRRVRTRMRLWTAALTAARALLAELADAWNRVDAAAGDCFTADAVALEPPDRQVLVGRDQLVAFFGDTSAGVEMSMSASHMITYA